MLYEDALPDGYPYDLMFPHSIVDGVRLFPNVSRFKEFRADGGPICPHCGEDELYSIGLMNWNGRDEMSKPPMIEILEGQFQCYLCHWGHLGAR